MREEQAWCSESSGCDFEVASPYLRGKVCLGLFVPYTLLMWEPLAIVSIRETSPKNLAVTQFIKGKLAH